MQKKLLLAHLIADHHIRFLGYITSYTASLHYVFRCHSCGKHCKGIINLSVKKGEGDTFQISLKKDTLCHLVPRPN